MNKAGTRAGFLLATPGGTLRNAFKESSDTTGDCPACSRPISGQWRFNQIHATRPTHIISSDDSASARVECITSGAITPATMPLAVEPITACSDDARPRRSG